MTHEVKELVHLIRKATHQARVQHGGPFVVPARLESASRAVRSEPAQERAFGLEVPSQLLKTHSVALNVARQHVDPEATRSRELHLLDDAHGRRIDVARCPCWRETCACFERVRWRRDETERGRGQAVVEDIVGVDDSDARGEACVAPLYLHKVRCQLRPGQLGQLREV